MREIVNISMIAEMAGLDKVTIWRYRNIIPWEFIDSYGTKYISHKNAKKVVALINEERKNKRVKQYEKVSKAHTKRYTATTPSGRQEDSGPSSEYSQQVTQPIEQQPIIENSLPSENWKIRCLQEYLKEKGLTTIPRNPLEIHDYSTWLKKQGYKPTSISAALVPVREIYRTLGIETKKTLQGPRNLSNFLKDPVSEEGIAKLLKYVDEKCGLRDQVIIGLMVYLGLRDVEISRMDFEDFCLADSNKWIAKLWSKKHNTKDTQITVSNGLLTVFLQYHEQRGEQIGEDSGQPMFIGQKKNRLRPDVVSQIVSKIMIDAGIKTKESSYRITPHSLRHAVVKR